VLSAASNRATINDMTRRLEYCDIDTIQKAQSNPKRHDLDKVQSSIDRFGYVAPMIIDERTGHLVVGHGRLESLQTLKSNGGTPPEGITTTADGHWHAPVIRGWSSRSDADAAAYLVADNRHTELGGWDHQALADLLDQVADPDLIDLTGWDLDELAKLLDDDTETMPDEGDASIRGSETTWGVAVTCRDEQQQTELLERLNDEGYEVRALM
jgi:hypothetical protein